MADTINQFTLDQDTLWYIDSVQFFQEEGTAKISGWILSKTGEIEDILINKKSLNPKFSFRGDVDAIHDCRGLNSGFELEFNMKDVYDTVQVKLKNSKELISVGSLAKWVAFYSGFKSIDKGVIVVDDFYSDPDFVREWVIKEIEFSPSNYHKGERATSKFFINGTKEMLEHIIGKPIYNWEHERYANGIFQFCTADQPIVYHVDNQTYAGIVFLTPDAPLNTGTSFYRSKETGDFKFDDEKRSTESYVRAFKGKSDEMNFYDGTNFEKIDEVGNKYNRLVLFDAKNIHAATQYFGDAIDNSRLFHMFFFDV